MAHADGVKQDIKFAKQLPIVWREIPGIRRTQAGAISGKSGKAQPPDNTVFSCEA